MQCRKKIGAYEIPNFLSRHRHSNISEKPAVMVLNCSHSSSGEIGTTNRAEVLILRLTNMVLIYAQAAIVHKLGGAHENILNNFMQIKCCSAIDAIPLMYFPAILILGTITCDHEPVSGWTVSPSNFCGATGEAMATKPP